MCAEAEETVVTVQTAVPLEYEARRKKELSIEHDQLCLKSTEYHCTMQRREDTSALPQTYIYYLPAYKKCLSYRLLLNYSIIFSFHCAREICFPSLRLVEDRGGTVVKVLCYKSEGRWFDPRWCHWNFTLT